LASHPANAAIVGASTVTSPLPLGALANCRFQSPIADPIANQQSQSTIVNPNRQSAILNNRQSPFTNRQSAVSTCTAF
jgi:hypothetical protein